MDKNSLKVGTFLNLFGTYKNCPMWQTFILLILLLAVHDHFFYGQKVKLEDGTHSFNLLQKWNIFHPQRPLF